MREKTLVASLLASLLAACGLTFLLPLEQQRSVKPSDIATLYLVASILCDIILLTMPSGIAYSQVSSAVLIRGSVHAVLLLLECGSKHQAASFIAVPLSPEELSGVLSRVFFTWIISILLQGYTGILVDQDLPCLSQNMKPERTRRAILGAWAQRRQFLST